MLPSCPRKFQRFLRIIHTNTVSAQPAGSICCIQLSVQVKWGSGEKKRADQWRLCHTNMLSIYFDKCGPQSVQLESIPMWRKGGSKHSYISPQAEGSSVHMIMFEIKRIKRHQIVPKYSTCSTITHTSPNQFNLPTSLSIRSVFPLKHTSFLFF